MMDRLEVFAAWAPEESPWSRWVKPILFADPDISISMDDIEVPDPPSLAWAPASANPPVALVLDIPGAKSVVGGVALARRGFCPVPLFNGAPGIDPLVPWAAIVKALFTGAEELESLRAQRASADYRGRETTPTVAPPVFLLDSNRLAGARMRRPGAFDNRWVVFTIDVPSGEFLRAQGIERVIVRTVHSTISEDLSHILRMWGDTGLKVELVAGDAESSKEVQVAKPSSFRRFLFRAMVFLRLHRNAAGAFGSKIPQPRRGLG